MRRFTLITLIAAWSMLTLHGQDLLRPRGDVNCDWEVTIADVNVLINSILNDEKYHSLYRYAHDVNGDREITIADINAVIGKLLGGTLPPMPSFSGTLPVMYINTEGYRDITSKDYYLHADWWIDAMGIEGYESLGSSAHPLGMQIKGRGNYTWSNMDKKPFRLKFDNKQKPLGMNSNKHFCLLATDYWSNPLGFELSRRIGLAYTPAQEPVEVVLNGQYIGLYFLTEKIRIDKNRVNVIEQDNGDEDPNLITGGWLLELGNRIVENQFIVYEDHDTWIGVEYQSPDSLSQAQYDYIYQFFTDTNSAIHATDSIDSIASNWQQYIDIDTLACFYIVNEIADNIESFSNSLFVHKQRGDSTKLLFGPVWDFGAAYNRQLPEGPCFIYENNSYVIHWLRTLATFPEFQHAVKQHWDRLNDAGALETMEQYMDSVVDKINPASHTDKARWPQLYKWFKDVKQHSTLYYKPMMRGKIDFLHQQWDEPQQAD